MERRKHPRVSFKQRIRIEFVSHLLGMTSPAEIVWTDDIGIGGIKIQTSQELPRKLFCRLFMPKNLLSSNLVLEGEVAYSTDRAEGMNYETGIRFSSLNIEQEAALNRIVESFSYA